MIQKVFIDREKHIEIVEYYDVDGETYSLCDFYYELEPSEEQRPHFDQDGNYVEQVVQGYKAFAWRFGVPKGQEVERYMQVAAEKGYQVPAEIIVVGPDKQGG